MAFTSCYFSCSRHFTHKIVSIPCHEHFQFSTSCTWSHKLTLTISPYLFCINSLLRNSIPLHILQLTNHVAFHSPLCHILLYNFKYLLSLCTSLLCLVLYIVLLLCCSCMSCNCMCMHVSGAHLQA